jgi:pimeloyl-ACP methyl ester carboxylesterase
MGEVTQGASAPAHNGTGPPGVLMLHGQPGSAADWDGVVQRLGIGSPPPAAIAIDRPGWDGATPAGDLEGNARAALAALDARGIGTAVVVGHSLGGTIAAWLAATRPERVAALVLAAPAANAASLYPADRWLAAPLVGEIAGGLAMASVGVVLGVSPVRRRISAATGVPEDYLLRVRRAALLPAGWRAYASEQRTLVHEIPRLEQRLATIVAPTTIITGARDRIVPVRASRRLSEQIPGARLIICQTAGHLLPQRAPQVIADAILAALASPRPARLGGG